VITLRPYQLDAIARVRTAMRGTRRVLLVAPTGFGKTAVASELIRSAVERGRKVLFLVHRREIVHDTARRLRAAEVHCAICMAGVASHGEVPVTVASVQTIIAREARPPADLVIWDEAHHTVADSYREIASAYPDAYHLGLTATPERSDRQGLRDAFDAIVPSCKRSASSPRWT
jgi:superfamily II DNA or RNA helicase